MQWIGPFIDLFSTYIKQYMDKTEILFMSSLLLLSVICIALFFYGRKWIDDMKKVTIRLQHLEAILSNRAETCPVRMKIATSLSTHQPVTANRPDSVEQIRRYTRFHYPNLINEIEAYASDKLTPSEELLCMMIKMEYSNKEISSILSITNSSVITARYRLKRKLDIPSDTQLDSWIIGVNTDIPAVPDSVISKE